MSDVNIHNVCAYFSQIQILSFLWPLTYTSTLTVEWYSCSQPSQKVNSTILPLNQKVAGLKVFFLEGYIFVPSKTLNSFSKSLQANKICRV